jgi:hypothetical protein
LDERVLLALACKNPAEYALMMTQDLFQIPEHVTDELMQLVDDRR